MMRAIERGTEGGVLEPIDGLFESVAGTGREAR
jgi:hypothetical protein